MFGRKTPGEVEARQGSLDPYERARDEMIEQQLRRRGIVMHSVLEAMRAVPRHLFVAHQYAASAYADEALPSLEGQTISQPYMVGIMSQELRIKPGQRILEIGTGTGYQTAVLAHLAGQEGQVFTIEKAEALAKFARHRLEAMDVSNVHFYIGDGSSGWPRRAGEPEPEFDRILVTAGAPEAPLPLFRQLADGGIMMVPVGPSDSQMLVRIDRQGERMVQTDILACRFVPLVGAHGWGQKTQT